MTEREINMAIAEACGWTELEVFSAGHPDDDMVCGYEPNGVLRGKLPIPDYCNDLNAMHEGERFLWADGKESYNPFIRREYLQELDRVTHCQWSTVSATARQRAEAFLRTVGK